MTKTERKGFARLISTLPRNRILLASLVCAVVFVCVFFWPFSLFHKQAAQYGNMPAAITMQSDRASCNAPVQSFCTTQAEYTEWVTHGYFSNIVEHERPILAVCGYSQIVTTAECNGVKSGTVINLYAVGIDGGTLYQSRNEYIAYFSSISRAFGAFRFVADKEVGDAITMNFMSAKASKTYVLTFKKINSSWSLQAVSLQ